MKLIKLTNNSVTKNNTKWGVGKTVSIDPDKRRPELCTNGVLHAYESIEQALLMFPAHLISYDNIVIYECDGDVIVSDTTKVGCYELTPLRRRRLTKWYADKDMRKRIQVQFAILCAKAVLPIFESRLPDDKRPRLAIEAAERLDDLNAIKTVAYDAFAAAKAAAKAAAAAYAAADAADAAYAAYAAAADAAAASININKLAKQAVKMIKEEEA